MNQALIDINTMINEGNDESLMVALTTDYAGINNVQDGVSERYYKQLQQRREEKGEVIKGVWLQKRYGNDCMLFVAFDEGRNIGNY